MKKLIYLLPLLLLGCASSSHKWGLVNSTRWDLDVYKNGQRVSTLKPGDVTTIPSRFCEGTALVSVSAYDTNRNFIGANTYTYHNTAPYNWLIDAVQSPVSGWTR